MEFHLVIIFSTCNDFLDIDECDANTPSHDCVAMAFCNNNNGSFECTCPNGFEGNGRTSGSGCAGWSLHRKMRSNVIKPQIVLLLFFDYKC